MEQNGDLVPHYSAGGQRFYDRAEIEELARVDRDMGQVIAAADPSVPDGPERQPHPSGQTLREMLEDIRPPNTHSAGVAAVRWQKELLELEAQRKELIPASSVAKAFNDFLDAYRNAFGDAFCRRMEAEWGVQYDWMYAYAADQETALCDLINEWAEREMG